MRSIFDERDMLRDMQPYDADRACPKCKGEDVATRYNKGHNCGDKKCDGQVPEHFVRYCRRCSFDWFESVL